MSKKVVWVSLTCLFLVACQSTNSSYGKKETKYIPGFSVFTKTPQAGETFEDFFDNNAAVSRYSVIQSNSEDNEYKSKVVVLNHLIYKSRSFIDDSKLLLMLENSCGGGNVVRKEKGREQYYSLFKSEQLGWASYDNGNDVGEYINQGIKLYEYHGLLGLDSSHWSVSEAEGFASKVKMVKEITPEVVYFCIVNKKVDSAIALGHIELYTAQPWLDGKYLGSWPSMTFFGGNSVNLDIERSVHYWSLDLKDKNEAMQLEKIRQKDLEKHQKILRAKFKSEMSHHEVVWSSRLSHTLDIGDTVCTYRNNYLGYVEDKNLDRVKVFLTRKVIGPDGLFYGNFPFNNYSLKNGKGFYKYNYTEMQKYEWVDRGQVALCTIENNI